MAIVTVDFDGTLYQGNSFTIMMEMGKKRFTIKQWAVVGNGLVKAAAVGAVKGKNRFRHDFFKAFARAFKGNTDEELEQFFRELVKRGKKDVHGDLVETIREHQRNGDTVVLLSGALQPFLKLFAQELQLDVHILSTELECDEDGICTGELGQIVNGRIKVERLLQWIDSNQHSEAHHASEIWAYADSESDIPLLHYATHPILVNPKEDMIKVAEQNKWAIFAGKHGDSSHAST
ncbi:HAD family hydrolase [Rossellomorea sp. AcN35-11]|nr:haloacid dehalogenase-like hydrolase [Rossellomorea aquimaris]NMH68100.1 haloacid dehalogenase-like hydrolase [Bacillus sp. RO3]WJV29925.1 HAD family hydrolase [Rossellomorea sp. AcN35-11]